MDITQEITALPTSITNELNRQVTDMMDKSGMMYRVFSRTKSPDSVKTKLEKKDYTDGKKMQDLFGVRIALYFTDDVVICDDLIRKNFVVDNVSRSEKKDNEFAPEVLNYVCKLPQQIKAMINPTLWEEFPFDDTFEIQVRTVFSEGWHEIEHDLRYKCKRDWESEMEINRTLNGILATLETCDWSIITLFDRLAYRNYQQGNWQAMFRNKWRLRIQPNSIDQKILTVLDSDHSIAKELFKIQRSELIRVLNKKGIASLPKNYNNLIYIANAFFIKNQAITDLTPLIIIQKCEDNKNES